MDQRANVVVKAGVIHAVAAAREAEPRRYEAEARRYEAEARRYEAETRRYEAETRRYEAMAVRGSAPGLLVSRPAMFCRVGLAEHAVPGRWRSSGRPTIAGLPARGRTGLVPTGTLWH